MATLVDNVSEIHIIVSKEWVVVSFERAFSDTERAADSTLKSAADLMKQVRALKKAAHEGNIAAIKRAQRGIYDALSVLRQDVDNASSIWPFQDEEEKQYLNDLYVAELRRAAEDMELKIYERDGSLISYPSIVRILPGDRAVRVDSKRVAAIRPSYLVSTLLKNQQKPLRRLPMTYLNALYSVYSDIVSVDSPDRIVKGSGRVVPLARIYRLLTSLPGSRREYSRTDFARDLYILESDGPRRTTSGAVVSFPSSTGAKRRTSDLFSFIGPDGQSVEYYGIRFTEGD